VSEPSLPAVLSVEDLVVRFKTRDGIVYAVNGASFDVREAETLGLVGESGCGKTVTSLAIMRLLPRASADVPRGRVLFQGRNLLELRESAMRDLRGKEMAMIFQNPATSLNPVLPIGKQLTETILAHRKIGREEARARAEELLAMVGISGSEGSLSEYPHRFSGGMQQRIVIAIALALEPKLLIADEPTTALDVTIQAQILDILRELARRSAAATLLITHDLGVVAGMTQRIAVMYAGCVVETASTERIFDSPRHPYTVGLLHSIPSLDENQSELVAIEGTPPEQRHEPVGCPFAPRCAWRLPVCWTSNPPLQPVSSAEDQGHQVACHNPATAQEVEGGRPLRPGFVAAPPPDASAPSPLHEREDAASR
jgi:oligopeptide/dipeptide ABC transporter ATP-binding protein